MRMRNEARRNRGRWVRARRGFQELGRGLARLAIGLVATAALAAPWGARAQHYDVLLESSPYVPIPLPGGQPETVYSSSQFQGWGYTPQTMSINLPFPVGFFGQTYSSLVVRGDGMITFDMSTSFSTTRTMRPIPGAAPPHNFVAGWWDQMVCNNSPGGPLKTQVVGTAPSRKFVIEWNNCRRYASSGEATFQIWLSEGSDEVEVRYGPLTGSNTWQATMGVENHDGTDGTHGLAIDGTNCGTTCSNPQWPQDHVLRYSSGPALRVENIQADYQGYAGLPVHLSFVLANPGSKPAENFTVQYWVSKIPEITSESFSMGYADRTWTLNPRESTTVVTEPRLPIELEEGSYYILVEADPDHAVQLSNRTSTIGIFGPIEVGIRAPNLMVPWVDVADLVHPGDTVDVQWLVRNSGNQAAKAIPFRVVLERGRFLSPVSPTLASGLLDELGEQQELFMETRVRIPDDTEPGVYFIGVEVNGTQDVFEHERQDNFGFSLPVVVSEEDLVVVTKSLPTGHIHGHYEVRLLAAGGDGRHHWSVRPGTSLPPGLRLDVREAPNGEVATFLVGQPGAVGVFPLAFVVRSGELSVDADLELEISAAEYELTIATESLAEASFGFSYHDELSAMGGMPPYTWEALGEDPLPHGMFLRSDGVLSGRPQEDGVFEFLVRVTDYEGRQATKTLVLRVAPPATLTCVTQELPELAMGEFFQTQLLAAGGKKRADGTYVWTHQNLIRVADELGEVSGLVRDDLGLILEHNGIVRGNPRLFGTYLWTVRVTDDTPGAPGVDCPILVRIPHDRGLTVVTQQLPAAIAGRSYRAQLEAVGGEGEITWSEYGSRSVLEDVLGLRFDATGSLVGTPPVGVLQGEEEREFSITVRAQDARGRIGIGVVNFVVKAAPQREAAPKEEEGGCQAGSGGPMGGLILLVGLALLRRRRS